MIVKDENAMTNQSNFDIKSTGQISKEFIDRNILTFNQATLFVKELAYGRNADKNNLASVFTDNCGTCSTKHALLKKLADENNFETLKLIVGIFRMNKNNTPEISATLLQNNLDFIPEAHCYLKFEDQILDLTKINSNPKDFVDDLIEEIEILPEQITDYKVNYHKNYLVTWLDNNKQINFSLNDIWKIREQCIEDLANNL
jgi:thiol-disulfide isomerase/thioredoxin